MPLSTISWSAKSTTKPQGIQAVILVVEQNLASVMIVIFAIDLGHCPKRENKGNTTYVYVYV